MTRVTPLTPDFVGALRLCLPPVSAPLRWIVMENERQDELVVLLREGHLTAASVLLGGLGALQAVALPTVHPDRAGRGHARAVVQVMYAAGVQTVDLPLPCDPEVARALAEVYRVTELERDRVVFTERALADLELRPDFTEILLFELE